MAQVTDYIKQSGFTIRERTPQYNQEINIHRAGVQNPVPSPMILIDGQRLGITSGGTTDYYTIRFGAASAPSGVVVAGGVDWTNVPITPTTRRAYAAGAAITFVPYVEQKAVVPPFRVKQHEHFQISVWDYVDMAGGSVNDLSATALGGGPEVKLTTTRASTAVSPVVTVRGIKQGTTSFSIRVNDKHQGALTLTVQVVVAHANRAPHSIKALGNPTLVVGTTQVYELTEYFTDPDGDSLSFVVSGQNQNVTGTLDGTRMTVAALNSDSVTLDITASDPAGLSVSQQMYVTVPVNRRPQRIKHVDPVALALGGATVERDIRNYFSDPDRQPLSWQVQWEEGDPARQYEREMWSGYELQGTNLLKLRSLFEYPGQGNAVTTLVPQSVTRHTPVAGEQVPFAAGTGKEFTGVIPRPWPTTTSYGKIYANYLDLDTRDKILANPSWLFFTNPNIPWWRTHWQPMINRFNALGGTIPTSEIVYIIIRRSDDHDQFAVYPLATGMIRILTSDPPGNRWYFFTPADARNSNVLQGTEVVSDPCDFGTPTNPVPLEVGFNRAPWTITLPPLITRTFPNTKPPWGTGTAWKVPAGTKLTLSYQTGGSAIIWRGRTHAAATATWDVSARKVLLDLRTAVAVPSDLTSQAFATLPQRVLLGDSPAVSWFGGGQTDDAVINFLPGQDFGHRTAYVRVWDSGDPPLDVSDLFNVALGRSPVSTRIPQQILFTGSDAIVKLDDYFSDPDGDSLTYTVRVSADHYVSYGIQQRQVVSAGSITVAQDLHLHGVTVGDVDITVQAYDPILLSASQTFKVSVQESAATRRPGLLSEYAVDTIVRRMHAEARTAIVAIGQPDNVLLGLPIFAPDSWRITRDSQLNFSVGHGADHAPGTDADQNDILRLITLVDGAIWDKESVPRGNWEGRPGMNSGLALFQVTKGAVGRGNFENYRLPTGGEPALSMSQIDTGDQFYLSIAGSNQRGDLYTVTEVLDIDPTVTTWSQGYYQRDRPNAKTWRLRRRTGDPAYVGLGVALIMRVRVDRAITESVGWFSNRLTWLPRGIAIVGGTVTAYQRGTIPPFATNSLISIDTVKDRGNIESSDYPGTWFIPATFGNEGYLLQHRDSARAFRNGQGGKLLVRTDAAYWNVWKAMIDTFRALDFSGPLDASDVVYVFVRRADDFSQFAVWPQSSLGRGGLNYVDNGDGTGQISFKVDRNDADTFYSDPFSLVTRASVLHGPVQFGFNKLPWTT